MATRGDSYVRQLQNIDAAIKRLNLELKKARTKKKLVHENFYKWMNRNGYDNYNGIKASKLEPKQIPRKKQKEKKEAAIQLFSEIGIPDPEDFWFQFQTTQKNLPPDEI